MPMRDGEVTVAGRIGDGTDITERRRAEEALRRSEESHRAMVQHASYAIYRSTPDGRFLTVNPALVAMLGYESAEQLLGVDLATDVYADRGGRAHPGALRALGRRHRGGRGGVEAPQRPGDHGAARRPRGPPRRR